jgi:hypothetical protein
MFVTNLFFHRKTASHGREAQGVNVNLNILLNSKRERRQEWQSASSNLLSVDKMPKY